MSVSRAGLTPEPTGGNWAVSPTIMSLQSVPEYTYSIRSSRTLPLPKMDTSFEVFEIIEASSTMKKVFLLRFLSRTKVPIPSLTDFCR